MEEVIKNENIEKVIVYSKWNKLVISKAETSAKKWLNILKYGLALLIMIFGLIALWFSAQWQTPNVLKALGIDISKYSNYVSTDAAGKEINDLITNISKYQLWDLKGSLLTEAGVQAMVAMGLISLASVIPLLIFRNGTAWSIGSIAVSLTLFIIVISLFSLGLASQSSALKNSGIVIDSQAAIDSINVDITYLKGKIHKGDNLTFEQIIENNKYQGLIENLNTEKNKLLVDFLPKLKDFLNRF